MLKDLLNIIMIVLRNCLKDERNFKEIVNKKYRKFFKEESSKDRLYIKLKVYLPFVANLYDKMRK